MGEIEHKECHKKLHKCLDELLADFLFQGGKVPSECTVTELLSWSCEQTENPTGHYSGHRWSIL